MGFKLVITLERSDSLVKIHWLTDRGSVLISKEHAAQGDAWNTNAVRSSHPRTSNRNKTSLLTTMLASIHPKHCKSPTVPSSSSFSLPLLPYLPFPTTKRPLKSSYTVLENAASSPDFRRSLASQDYRLQTWCPLPKLSFCFSVLGIPNLGFKFWFGVHII